KGGAFHEPGATPDAPAPGQSPAARNPPEASGDIGGARASHCVRLYIPGGGDTAAQLRRVTADVISTGRIESAAVYCEAELDASAMALGRLGHHAPVSVEREAIADGVEQLVAEASFREQSDALECSKILRSNGFDGAKAPKDKCEAGQSRWRRRIRQYFDESFLERTSLGETVGKFPYQHYRLVADSPDSGDCVSSQD